jgi:PGF-CTERM protein
MNKKKIFTLLAAVMIVSVTGVAGITTSTAQQTSPTRNIVQTAQADGNFTKLVAAIQAAGLTATLSGPGPFTVFAPTDAAFAKLPAGVLDCLLNNSTALNKVLTYHVVSGLYLANNLTGKTSLKTVEGNNVSINTASGVKVGGATVTKADISTSNGEIHAIDTVIIPPDVALSSVCPGLVTTTNVTKTGNATTAAAGIPGFEAVFALAGLLAVAYLVMRQRR